MDFVHLNFHSDFSLRDSCCAISKLPEECNKRNFEAVALTDTCSIRGVIKFYKKCAFAENPIKPIIGSKLLIRDEKNYPLIVLAKNDAGFDNLRLISNNSQVEGWDDKKALTSVDFLKEHSEGLICIATDINGKVNRLARRDKVQEAYQEAVMLKDIFGEDLYLEVQENKQLDQPKTNKNIIDLSKRIGSKVVATNDVRYYNKKDYIAHVALIADRKRTQINNDRFTYLKTNERYFRSFDEMKLAFNGYPNEIFTNTVEVAEKCELKLSFGGMRLPVYDLPEGFSDDWEYLRHLAFKGLEERGFANNEEYVKRLEDELFDVRMVNKVKKYNFARYFLMVWDYVNHAHKIGCKVGVGRGCLTYDSLVRVENDEFKKLGDIKVGDMVLNRHGEYDKVINTMEYDCDEELVEFHVRCQSRISKTAMTKDHEVLALKNPFNKISKKGWVENYNQLNKIDYFNKDSLEWLEADKLSKGDYLVRSVDYEDEVDICEIDMSVYAEGMDYDDKYIYEKHPHPKNYIFSLRKLAKISGLSRSSLNLIKQGKVDSVRNIENVNKLVDFLSSNGKTIEDFIKMKNYRIAKINRFIKVNEEFLYFYGIYVGDGWNRKGRVGTAFHSINNLDSKNRVERFLNNNGFFTTEFNARGKKLTQLVVNSLLLNRMITDICPNYSTHRKIMDNFMKLPKVKKRFLLDGLMNSDGHRGIKTCYDTTHYVLALQVRKLFESLGKVCAIRKRQPYTTKDGYVCRESYKVVIMDSDKSSNYYNDGQYVYTRIINKKYIENKSGKVYDITVENNPSYHTDDFIVHNSACGSLLLYCLRITNVDPIDYQLYWWRFLTVDKKFVIEEKDFV